MLNILQWNSEKDILKVLKKREIKEDMIKKGYEEKVLEARSKILYIMIRERK